MLCSQSLDICRQNVNTRNLSMTNISTSSCSLLNRHGSMAEGSNKLCASFMDNFICKICLEVFHDPVQCQNNEHYFCRKCITKHLHDNTETCPLCADQLTLETLRPPSRIILDVISQLKRPRCSYVSRGCTENVTVEELLLHEQMCGYAPVVCLNEGCEETVNRRDKESHETEECKFRKITCDSCAEEMAYHEYETHKCTLRNEIDEMKQQLLEVTETLKQLAQTQTEILGNLKAHDQSIRNLQDPLRCASSTTFQREVTVVVNGQIFIFGGRGEHYKDGTDKSLEVFNWSTNSWTLVKKCLFFSRRNSFSFLYGKRIMMCGGESAKGIEYLTPSESGYTSTVFSASLPNDAQFNGVLYENRIFTFYKGVVQMSLKSPEESITLLHAEKSQGRSHSGVHCFGNSIYIIGGRTSSMEVYDVAKNELTILPSLPYTVSDMATVAYKDNIIILGGQDAVYENQPLNDVVMFNVTSQEYKRLPSMLEKRAGCAAVIVGDVIVVMGGRIRGNTQVTTCLKTVEYYVIGDSAWHELPAMNLAREGATACVYI